jgi:hypothetical protein
MTALAWALTVMGLCFGYALGYIRGYEQHRRETEGRDRQIWKDWP